MFSSAATDLFNVKPSLVSSRCQTIKWFRNFLFMLFISILAVAVEVRGQELLLITLFRHPYHEK